MISPFTAQTSAALTLTLLGASCALTRVLLPDLGTTRTFRLAALSLLAVVLFTHATWLWASDWSLVYASLRLAMVVLFALPFLLLSIPVAALMRRATKRALARRADVAGPTLGRRAVLSAATAIAPAVALGASVSGFVLGQSNPRIPRVPFAFQELPSALVGLRILHLSDLHLGADRSLEDLEALCDRLRGDVPDLVVLTGDVAEDPNLLDPALSALIRLNPRLGVYSSLGNHEYLNDVDRALAVYERRRDVRLLKDQGETVSVGGSRLFIGGANDPLFMSEDPVPFLRNSTTRAHAHAPPDAWKLLLSHRPEGLTPAAELGFDLVLSGHTHGGQIGFNGKSAFERIWPDRYLWGRYARGATRLYTTSGFGHWFPYRMDCPTEAPIIELARG